MSRLNAKLRDKRCNRCAFWEEDMTVRDPNDENWGWGDCRREPPRLIDSMVRVQLPRPGYGQQTDLDLDIVDAATASRFPATFATDWCGRFESAQPEMPLA